MKIFLFFILLFSKAVILTTNLDSKQKADYSGQLMFFCMNFVLILPSFLGRDKKKKNAETEKN